MTTETSNARGEWVPSEPTLAMLEALSMHLHNDLRLHGRREQFREAYTAMLAAAPPPAAARGDVPYDRELIAQIIDVPRAYTNECRQEQARLLREADNAAVANVGTVAARGDVRGLVAKWERDALVNVLSQGERAVLRNCTSALRKALAAEGVQAGEVVDDRFPAGLDDAIEYADEMEEAAAALYQQVIGHENDGSDTGTDMLHAVMTALSQQPEARGVVDGEQPARDQLAAWLRDLADVCSDLRPVGAWPGEKAAARLRKAADALSQREAGEVVDKAMVERACDAFIAAGMRERALPSISDRWMRAALTAALTGERNG